MVWDLQYCTAALLEAPQMLESLPLESVQANVLMSSHRREGKIS